MAAIEGLFWALWEAPHAEERLRLAEGLEYVKAAIQRARTTPGEGEGRADARVVIGGQLMLRRRHRPGDRARADALRDAALDKALDLKLGGLVRRISAPRG